MKGSEINDIKSNSAAKILAKSIEITISVHFRNDTMPEKNKYANYQQMACHHVTTQCYHYYQLLSSPPYHLHITV